MRRDRQEDDIYMYMYIYAYVHIYIEYFKTKKEI